MVLLGMRYAKGPDGTRGFAIGRGRPLPGGLPPPPPRQAPQAAAPDAHRSGQPPAQARTGAAASKAQHAASASHPPPASKPAQPAATPALDPTAQGAKSWASCVQSTPPQGPRPTDEDGSTPSITPPGCTPPSSHSSTPGLGASLPPGLGGMGKAFGLPSAAVDSLGTTSAYNGSASGASAPAVLPSAAIPTHADAAPPPTGEHPVHGPLQVLRV